ncbi:hypothetical protein FPS10_20515 [Pseudoruegeria sp. M32A2M]|nr:HAD hydrolase-like protein [Aliiruegeria sabulilitoris]NDR58774.1 hypothetical protein [Pseudoruegeria sp. M32A2M]
MIRRKKRISRSTGLCGLGDSPSTDILGAQTAGIASALISGYGFFAGYDVSSAIARTEIYPDHILERP